MIGMVTRTVITLHNHLFYQSQMSAFPKLEIEMKFNISL